MAGVIVQDWFAARGGAENVASEMARVFPDAPVLCLWGDEPFGGVSEERRWESWLSRTPLRRHKATALPAMIPTWRRLPGDPDWILVSSHLFAHHARFPAAPRAKKLVYAHTPARYVWSPELDGRGASWAAKSASRLLKPLDRKRAQEATAIAANSRFVRDRIAAAWGRESTVIYPPVDAERLQATTNWRDRVTTREERTLSRLPDHFIMGASRFVPYKGLDVVIGAGDRVGVPVVIAGAGPEEAKLREVAASVTVPVYFVLDPSDELLFSLYQRAAVLVFPPVEDFGIVPVEAMCLGTPAIVNIRGGARESLELAGGGASWDLNLDTFSEAFERALRSRPDTSGIASRFSRARFRSELRNWMQTQLEIK